MISAVIGIISTVIGGIGLFLLGMILMTDGLKTLTGDAVRSVLARFTRNRFSAVAAGASVTAVVQASSATTLATIGFVSAGLLTFQNSAGVIIGANLGTTSTGWLVSLLGLKLSLGKIMLPVIGVGALTKLIGKGAIAQAGMALAGFGVIFVGIDVLQAGMKELSSVFNPADFPQATLGGRALLVLIGAGMTVVMQSSSAAVATTLAALAGNTIDVEQAAALVIGQNVGTTLTPGLASIGASPAAKRTALVHVVFNVVTGAVAFVILPWFTAAVAEVAEDGLGGDHALTIAAFHTAFNLLGALIFVPVLPQFARLIERVVKIKGPRLTRDLDASLLSVPSLAIEAVRRTLKIGGSELFDYLADHLRGDRKPAGDDLIDELDVALDETRRYLAQVPPPDRQGYEFHRQISTLHAIDHLERLVSESREKGRLRIAQKDDHLRGTCKDLANLLDLLATQLREPLVEPDVERAQAFSQRLADERRTARPAILEATAARTIDPDTALAELAAQRWLDRVAYHIWRSSHHLREMTRRELAAQAHTSADVGMPVPPSPPQNPAAPA
ncbi:MAG: Na/Pi cotransporter family protein [Planctomycetes bacterium]|nr:Na/Pi cotransporter family protein [Planctomycetota bacterium]